jgi:threonine dehydrogenase-like Zn-dependent dehydrogenase
MRAAVMRDQKLVADTIPEPRPGAGEVVVRTLACGICGSDLHVLKHARRVVEVMRRSGAPMVMDLGRDVVMGHEFCAEIVEHGPGCQKHLKPGTRVCSMPIALRPSEVATIGYSNEFPGGYGEYMVLNEMLLLEVPNGLPTEHAALTEPMAVGWHAVEKANLAADDVPLVIGCGPIGLAVVAALRVRGVRPIVAADFSAGRRRLAAELGADIVVDPAQTSPYDSWETAAVPKGEGAVPEGPLAFLIPHLRPAVLFECVGVPGVIQQMLEGASRGARIVVVGVCMETDRLEPIFAINKELNLQFVLGYSPQEFAATLQHLAEGRIAAAPLITGKVGVEGVAGAFAELADPERHAKILVEPWRS